MSQAGYSNVTGNDLQNFNATTNGLDFVTVHGSETLFPGIANFGLFANFAINTLPRYKEQAGKDTYLGKVRDSLLASDFNFGLGLTKTIDVGFSLPFVVSQSVNVDGPRGEFGETGLTELRGNLKWRLVGNTDGGIAAIFSFNYNLVKNNPYMGVGAGPVANFELAFDTTIHRTAFAVNLGYRFRDQGDPIENFPIEPLGNQFIGSIAVSQLLPVIDTKLIGEIYTSTPVKDSETGSARSVSASELLIGAKYDYDRHTAIHLGMGSELDHGTASPDWRIYTGINYVTGYRKPDKKVKLVRAPPKSKKKAPKTPAPTPAPAIPALPPELSGQDQYPAEPPGIGDEVFVLRDINFAFDSAHRVLPGAKRTLKALATHLKARGYERIVIEGHTDSIGSENYNIKLGRKRASTIKKYMVQVEGLDPRRLKVLTYGEFRPIADNGNYQGRQLNRRVVFRVIYRKR
jgi:outer membrane protein OmpA-like peptidoglycan-associated protein